MCKVWVDVFDYYFVVVDYFVDVYGGVFGIVLYYYGW